MARKTLYLIDLEELVKHNRKRRVLVCHKDCRGWTVRTARFIPDGESHVWLFEFPRTTYATYPDHWQHRGTKRIPALSEPLSPRY